MKLTTAIKILCQAILLGVVAIGANTNAATLSFNQGVVDTSVDQSFSLDITATNFPATFGGSILITYDPNVLSIDDVTLAAPFKGAAIVPQKGAKNGLAALLVHVPWKSLQPSGDFVFATVFFTAIAEGFTDLALSTLSAVPLSTKTGNKLTPIDFTAVNTTVNIKAVPLPAAVWLFMTGLLGLLATARKQFRAKPNLLSPNTATAAA